MEKPCRSCNKYRRECNNRITQAVLVDLQSELDQGKILTVQDKVLVCNKSQQIQDKSAPVQKQDSWHKVPRTLSNQKEPTQSCTRTNIKTNRHGNTIPWAILNKYFFLYFYTSMMNFFNDNWDDVFRYSLICTVKEKSSVYILA